MLQSGEDPHYTGEMLADIARRIKADTGMAITFCVGERPYEDYKLWKEAGVDRYLLRHETANRELYQTLHPDGDFDNRMRCLRWLREFGYQTGAGCMVGTPCQTMEHLADDIEFFRDFQPDMAGIGPFIPHPDTPCASSETGTVEMTLKMVALGAHSDPQRPPARHDRHRLDRGTRPRDGAGGGRRRGDAQLYPGQVSRVIRDIPQQTLHQRGSRSLRRMYDNCASSPSAARCPTTPDTREKSTGFRQD